MGDSASAEMFYELESSGYKLTKFRRAMIEIFCSRQQPFLLEELSQLLHDRFIKVHKVSLYRELEFLEARQIIVPVTLDDGMLRYEFAEHGHHHHLVCERCHKIEEVELEDDAKLEKMITTKTTFQVIKHHLEFSGLCGKCAKV